jgi:hypothetical protein
VATERYLAWKGTKHQTTTSVACQLGISRDRLTSLENGDSFFQWDLPWRLKALFDRAPERPVERDARLAREQAEREARGPASGRSRPR